MTPPRWANTAAQPVWHGGDPVPGPLDGRDDAGYADLRDYASIGDGRTIALIARDGSIDWLPLPNLDSVPPFGALLDAEQGGHIALAPVEEATVERRYVPGTNVLETTYTTASGRVRVTDSLNTGLAGRLPWCELGRRIDGLEGSVPLRAHVVPGTCLNTASPWVYDSVHGKVLRLDGLTMAVRTLAEESVQVTARSITVEYRTSPGSRHLLGLTSTDSEPLYLPTPQDIDDGVDRTIANWRAWSDAFVWDGPWQEEVQRSALTLKQLIFAPTGALAAAATTSLPESHTKDKNWDYRYSWVRDTAFSLTALFRFGVREETHGAISWMLRILREQGSQPQVLQRLDGAQCQDEITTYDVPGWRGAGTVRSGNQASDQLQLGIYGDIFSIVQLYVDNGNVLDEGTGRLLTTVADLACDTWRSPDSGMWELPDEQHYTTSKLGCWQALTHAVHLAEIGQIPGSVDRWRHEADEIAQWVSRHCWNEDLGAYEWYPGSGMLDASILLHAISGFDRGERMSRTLDALAKQLGDGPLLYRYSGVDQEELTFTACSFWRVSALALVGRVEEARDLMDELVGTLNDVGLLSEMIDARTGAFGGNLPQALSHLALVNAAITVHGESDG
ncbi:glycoside hydrolase family 15 protein [Allobranchiibius sp. GilTou73]|uniref:glycoside hydrolase family 15 protein n=1 Tax=Allobranchiibius sp. GilTou73 TaxID=2904523 RepID=UPI001F191AFC|nr:glycoside hydrolase family 15 protein [Allobranchiibius sp. GilTou73]UIJ34518.1 glycoside hydrolase family 15 protein [Allobranchiibius sp. GilTou73]